MKIWTPEDSKTARAFFNKKHGYHAFVFFIVVTADGKIVYISDVRGGTEHDKTHWNESDVPEELENVYCQEKPAETILSIGGDKAYRGVRRPKEWENRVTKSAEEEENDEAEDHENSKGNKEWWCEYIKDVKIARPRAVVERSIGAMKKWLILENEALISRVMVDEMRSLLVLIAALTNYQLITNRTW